MGLIFDIHGYRGFVFERDLLHWKATAAFVTLMLCRFCVTDRLALISEHLKQVRNSLEGR